MVVVLSVKNNNKQIGCLTVETRGSTQTREVRVHSGGCGGWSFSIADKAQTLTSANTRRKK